MICKIAVQYTPFPSKWKRSTVELPGFKQKALFLMTILYVKAVHIISVVCWFAGLFYIVRLFVYHTEAQERPEAERLLFQEQFKIMQRRLWFGITWPSMIATLVTGTWMLIANRLWAYPWMQVKLVFLLGLIGYHMYCHKIVKQLKQDQLKHSPIQLRILNEGATLFLVAIVFLAILKSTVNFLWGLLGLVVFAVVLMIAIRIYRKIRLGNTANKVETSQASE